MAVVGIDPGLKGAVAVLGDQVDVIDMPTRGKEIDGSSLAAYLSRASPGLAVVEKVHSMPRQGVRSTFTFGKGVGVVLGVLQALKIPWVEVSPQAWQKAVLWGVPGEGKARSLLWARKIFPGVLLEMLRGRKLDGRADALALVWYGVSEEIDIC
jgi:Holliday junction resolvasome RuvABC endonuclease subunit